MKIPSPTQNQTGTNCFLLGGSPAAYEVYADEFVQAAGGSEAAIAVLGQTRRGLERFGAEILRPWKDRGVRQFQLIAPEDDGAFDLQSAMQALQSASGIFIGGGVTSIYHRFYGSDPIRSLIAEKYRQGVPVAGISAGALLSMQHCQFSEEETPDHRLPIVQGLGLVSGFVIGVHFSECNALPEVLEVMAQTRTSLAYGIDEPACLVCENGMPSHVLGKSVYRIEMTDIDHHVYRMEPLS